MSKKSPNIKELIAKKRWINELNRKNLYYSSYRPRKKENKKQDHEFIIFPKNFDIYSLAKELIYKETMNVIGAISRLNLSDFKKVNLDFSQTENIKAASVLILYATVEQVINQGISFKIISLPRDFKATKTIKDSGLISLCKKNLSSPNFNGERIPVISGSGGDFREEIVDFIQHKIYKNKMSPHTESIYGGAIHEAINNVSYHAYPTIEDGSHKKWWVKCDLADNQLFLAIYDKGVGIPETVMGRAWYGNVLKITYPEIAGKVTAELKEEGLSSAEILRYKVGSVSDAMKIAISMIGDVTGTAESKHGQGSKSIKGLVSENDIGTLWIYSNNGLYKLNAGKIEIIDLPKPMPGTLIQWNIKVDPNEN